jgi:hypothetical protein
MGLSRIAYQANLQVLAGLNLLAGTPGKPFASSVTVTAGSSRPGEITVPFPVWAPILLNSLDPVHIPVPADVTIPPPQTRRIFPFPPTVPLSAPLAEISVPVVAVVNGLRSTVVVKVKAH